MQKNGTVLKVCPSKQLSLHLHSQVCLNYSNAKATTSTYKSTLFSHQLTLSLSLILSPKQVPTERERAFSVPCLFKYNRITTHLPTYVPTTYEPNRFPVLMLTYLPAYLPAYLPTYNYNTLIQKLFNVPPFNLFQSSKSSSTPTLQLSLSSLLEKQLFKEKEQKITFHSQQVDEGLLSKCFVANNKRLKKHFAGIKRV